VVKVLNSFVRGPLEPYVTGFAEELLRSGYTRTSASQHICFIAHLDRWMLAQGVELIGLSGPVMARYLAQRRAAGYVEYRSMKALQPLLAFLAPVDVLPTKVEPATPVEELLAGYRDYLITERALTPGTARCYVNCLRPFVATRLRGDALELAGITAADVTGFVLSACPGRAVGSAKLIVCALRSLLRWVHLTGQIPTALAPAVPSVAGWRLSGLPKALRASPYLYSDADIAALIAACSTLRDPLRQGTFATLIGLLAVTGLRVGEAIALDRDDVDLRAGRLTVRHGKFDKARELALHPSTVSALQEYQRLRDRRFPTTTGTAAWFVSLAGTRLLYCNVHHAFHRLVRLAGLTPRSASCRPRIHDLRHSFAVQAMLDAYATGQDGQVRLTLLSTWLGHVHPGSTYWYLSASPELMAVAGQRLEVHLAGQSAGQR
jgi:integrase/recombinase XerD